jgi:hypothetical protein
VAKRGRPEIVAALTAAMNDGLEVRIGRAPESAPALQGHVVAVGIRWCVVQPERRGIIDRGYTSVRLRDARRVRTVPGNRAVDVAALGLAIAAPVGVDPTTTGTLLLTAGDLFGLLTVHCERRRRPKRWTGRLVGVADKQLTFAVVDPATLRPRKTKSIAFGEVTRIEFGGMPVSG